MYTIGQVAKKFSVSRSTLIYYDSIGLLMPSGRSESNYRLYSDGDLDTMEAISQYRAAGLPLKSILKILNKEKDQVQTILESRLFSINNDIKMLRSQQKIILELLKSERLKISTRIITEDTWVSLLKSLGLDEAGMKKLHIEFEKATPEGHRDFLESIGLDSKDIEEVCNWSKDDLSQG